MANEGYIYFKNRAPKKRIAKAQTSREMLLEKREADPNYQAIQSAKWLTRETKARIGIDCLTKDLVKDQVQSGKIPSETAARAEAQAVAERAERKVDEGR